MSCLVTVARGVGATDEVAREITERAAAALGVPGIVSYVEERSPSLRSVVETVREPSVVVPLLLSTAHHLLRDLPGVASASAHHISVAPALGPHPLVAAAQAARLIAAGARPGQPVVMVALGSADPSVDHHLERAAQLLADTWTGPVELATLEDRGPRPEEVVRRGVVVSPYLLTPGPDAARVREQSLAAGALLVADVIGTHRFVSDLVARRFRISAQAAKAA
ncbi:CbiX/SirB N-terminal domain-containing protein [Nocardioides sp. W7]|uniref:sirohydrochlorin chelatase n=1 Tax=Nocardioides sp. W7 TaxID=2931390 RepID=UPI00246839ED|nr:CbiX/SirB N-terminal domain-containing protein [Nocardioides sp. W7]